MSVTSCMMPSAFKMVTTLSLFHASLLILALSELSGFDLPFDLAEDFGGFPDAGVRLVMMLRGMGLAIPAAAATAFIHA